MRFPQWAQCVRTGLSLFGFIAILLFCLEVPGAQAQFHASLSGTVTDPSGAVIGGATVTLTNTGTQASHTMTASGGGFYSFNQLPPGTYNLSVSASGFKSSTLNGITLVSDVPRTANVKLEIGAAAQTVTVNGNTVPLLQTSNANISGTLSAEQLKRIPAYGRDPYELLRLTPGITGDDSRSGNGSAVFLPNNVGVGQSNSGIFQTENQIQISANGQRIGDNNYLLDGVSVNSLTHGGAAVVTPNLEAVDQITVITSAYSAEYGRNTGAQILTTTRSGTNHFHGSASFTYDEPGLNAFNRYGGPTGQLPVKVENKERDWAAGLGGPIWPNKLFFFLSFEGNKSNHPTYESQFVETPEFRALAATDRPGGVTARILGSPLESPRIVKVLPADCTLAGGTQVSSVVLNNPNAYPGVRFPCNALSGGLDFGSPAGSLGDYSVPSFGGGFDNVPDVEYAQLVLPARSRGKQWNGRIDWYATPHDQIAGIAYFTKLDNFNAGGAAGSRSIDDIPFKPFNWEVTGIYIHTFGANTINELRVNGTRFADNGVRDSAGVVDWGVPYINVQGIPFAATNQLNFGPAAATTTPAIFAENTYEARDTVTHTHGSQTLHVGFEYRLEQDNDNLAGASRPTYAFNNMWLFLNDAPIFEAITANPLTGGSANTARYLWDHYYSVFFQDDWKATQNLTLNLGLRWEYFEPLYSHGADINYPVLGTTPGGELADAALVPHHHLWNPEYRDFSPRFGFAYVPPFTNQKMVVRGGFGLAYNRLPAALFNNAVEDGPGYFNFGLCCATTSATVSNPVPGSPPQTLIYETGSSTSPFSYAPNPSLITPLNAKNLPANGASVEVYGAPANLKVPYSFLYSLEVQQELPWDFVATLGYQGSTGRHYSRLVNQQFLYSTVGSPFINNAAYFAQDDSNEYYNGMNAHLSKRLRHGFLFDVIYTWSKSMDQVSNGDQADASANQTYPMDNRTELGPSDYDVRHRVTVSGLWTIPGTHGGNSLLKAITNGWQINGVYTFHTGFPFTPVTYTLHGLPTVQNTSTVSPVRPLAYLGGARTGCSNSLFEPGPDNLFAAGGTTYFDITPPPGSNGTLPGIGRNSFRGPCYHDADFSFAKEQHLKWLGDTGMIRFQANFYNTFNTLNLTPFSFASNATVIENSEFGQAQSADAGRVVEFLARLQF